MSIDRALNIAIVGGTRGIGFELCHHFAKSGHNIALCGRSSDPSSLASDLTRTYGVSAFGQVVDASDKNSCDNFAQHVNEHLGGVDALFANAAVFGPVGILEKVDLERWEDTLRLNTSALINPVLAFLPLLRKSNCARILTMSGGGLGGSKPIQRASAYFASKAATVALVEVLAEELLEDSITINAIAPGFFPTGFMNEAAQLGPEVAGVDLFQDASQSADDTTTRSFQLLTSLIDFLISPEAKQVTGRTLSARWDTSESILQGVTSPNLFRLRRVDNDLIRE